MMTRRAPAALICLLAVCAAQGQPPQQQPQLKLSDAEQKFQQAMTNVTLTGYFTVGDSGEPHDDRYTVEKVEKAGEGVWYFDARIQYNKKDYKARVKVPVEWAGDTPVLMLQNYLIAGQGVFSARILIHNGMYAGLWGNAKQGGKMFGKIVRNEPEPAKPPVDPPPPPPNQKP